MFTVAELGNVYGITVRQVEFYMLIGLCIKEWAKVEDQLFQLCALSLGDDSKRAAIVYYRTPGIDARLKLTDELIRTILPQRQRRDGGHDHPTVKEWNAIEKATRDLFATRNLLAHAPVEQRLHPDTPEEPALRIEISPDGTRRQTIRSTEVMWVTTSEHERLRGRADERISDSSLHHHLTTVHAAAERLAAFHLQAEALAAKHAPHKPRRASRSSGSPLRSGRV